MRWIGSGLVLVAGFAAGSAMAADAPGAGTIEVSKAWTPATAQTRGDWPLYMTLTNRGDAPDSLSRVRCPAGVADFTEKHATDRGEGGTAMREVKSFAIPAKETTTLVPGGNHLMLLNVREPLREGQTFTCAVVFQKAGTVPVEVRVVSSEAKEAP